MNLLFQHHARIIHALNVHQYRYLYHSIDWDNRLIYITGSRGTGKTTLMLQYIKENFHGGNKALYVGMDNLWFTAHSLPDLANKFYACGGTHLFLDEVHHYPDWQATVKNIHDGYPDMHLIFTASSISEMYPLNESLSRKTACYHLDGLSFREFLFWEHKLHFPVLPLTEILEHHTVLAGKIASKIKILPEFKKYLEYGYYPFYREGTKIYPVRLQKTVNTVLENDLPSIEKIEHITVRKIKKMLMLLVSLAPYTPNINKLSVEVESNRAHIIKYLTYLQKAGLIKTFLSSQKEMGLMNKPNKIYLDNTNLLYALTHAYINTDNVRETFFANQLAARHSLNITEQGHFQTDHKQTFETGVSERTFRGNMKEHYSVVDDMETGLDNKIPLWLFGFMY
jgi:predicted AAA+ superfamily ATPase